MALFSLDILLHQSGHIMLSDFDLAKQSDSVAQPTAITRPASDPNGVSKQFVCVGHIFN